MTGPVGLWRASLVPMRAWYEQCSIVLMELSLKILDVFVVVAGGATHAFMVAHVVGRPVQYSLLRLRRTNSTTDVH